MRKKVWVPGHWRYIRDRYGKIKRKVWVAGHWKTVDISSRRRWRW